MDEAHGLCGATIGALLTSEANLIRAVATRGYSELADIHACQTRPLGGFPQALGRGERISYMVDVRVMDAALMDDLTRGFVELTDSRR